MEEYKFAEFSPIIPNSSTDKEELKNYYLSNGILPDNPLMQNYLGITPETTSSYDVSSIIPSHSTKKSNFETMDDLFPVNRTASNPTESLFEYDDRLFGSVPSEEIKISQNTTDVGKKALNYLISKGLTKHVAAGIVGNLFVESSLNPGIEGDKHLRTHSEGLAQWREGRLENLKSFAKAAGKDYRSINVQLDFLMHELNTSENKTLQKLRNAKNPTDAARIFAYNFERMKTYDTKREQAANKFYNI